MTGGGSTDSDTERPYVEYCIANTSADRRRALQNADIPTRGVACLDRCGRCYRSQFLVVDGTPIDGPSCDRFVDELNTGDAE